jgi:hypothetical protein
MSAHGTRIWVVITDGVSTRISSCQDGVTTPITTPCFNLHGPDMGYRDVVPYSVWFKTERQIRLSQNPRHQHIAHVSQLLLEGARERAYDNLVIVAQAPIADQIENALAPETRALLIGKIIQDCADIDPEIACEQSEVRH